MVYDRHEENLRVIGDYLIKRTDPYGFWVVRKSQGATPKIFLDAQYTNTSQAVKAVENHIENKGK